MAVPIVWYILVWAIFVLYSACVTRWLESIFKVSLGLSPYGLIVLGSSYFICLLWMNSGDEAFEAFAKEK